MTTQTFILPASVEKPGIFLCTPVDAEVVARSTVLRDLSNTAGTATLPDGISEDDVLSWLSMDPKGISKRAFTLRELCTAMRVASRLGDSLATAFASALASKIRQQTENLADVEDIMLSLDQSAQHDVFQHCIHVAANGSVAELIMLWPKRLQQVFFDWHVQTTKRLMPATTATAALTLSLLATCTPPPGLTNLMLLDDAALPMAQACGNDWILRPACESPRHQLACTIDQAAVAPALAAHTTITNLILTVRPSATHAATLTPTLAALPGLTQLVSLTLHFDSLFPRDRAPDIVPALSAAVRGLAHLQHFSLLHMITETCLADITAPARPPVVPAEPPHKLARRSLSAGATALAAAIYLPPASLASDTLDPLIAALAMAPALATLRFVHAATTVPCTGIQGAFLALRELHLCGHVVSAPAARWCNRMAAAEVGPTLSALSDVLPFDASLSLSKFSMVEDSVRTPEVVVRLLRQLTRQLRLQELKLDLSSIMGGSIQVLGAMEVLLAKGRRTLTSLDLHLGVQTLPQFAPTVTGFAAAAERAPALRVLRLEFSSAIARGGDSAAAAVEDTPPPPLSFGTLTRLRDLSRLTLACGPSIPSRCRAKFAAAALGLPLASFTALTSLKCLCKAPAWGPADVFAAGTGSLAWQTPLRQLPRLRHLRELALANIFLGHGKIWRALRPLTALTRIELHVHPLTHDALLAFATLATWMPGLQETLFVQPEGTVASGAYARALPSLPPRGRYEFRGTPAASPVGALYRTRVRRALRAQGALVWPEFRAVEYGAAAGTADPWPLDDEADADAAAPLDSVLPLSEDDDWDEDAFSFDGDMSGDEEADHDGEDDDDDHDDDDEDDDVEDSEEEGEEEEGEEGGGIEEGSDVESDEGVNADEGEYGDGGGGDVAAVHTEEEEVEVGIFANVVMQPDDGTDELLRQAP